MYHYCDVTSCVDCTYTVCACVVIELSHSSRARTLHLRPIHHYLRRDVNKAFARVTGGKVYQGAGYGLEIPCVYQFLWTKALY